MMTQNADKKREQVQFFCMDDMVPQEHLLRIIDKAIDWNFIYDLLWKSILRITVAQVWTGHADKNSFYSVSLWHQKYASNLQGNRSKCSIPLVS